MNAECNRAHRSTPGFRNLGFLQQNLAAVHRPSHTIRRALTTLPALQVMAAPTKTFHEGEDTMWIETTNRRIVSAAKGSGDIKDITTLACQKQRHQTQESNSMGLLRVIAFSPQVH